MKIKDKAKEIIASLDQMGFGDDVDIPLLATKEWCDDLAVMEGMYFDRITHAGRAKLSDDQLLKEFEAFLQPFLGEFIFLTNKRKVKRGSIVVQVDMDEELLRIFRVPG